MAIHLNKNIEKNDSIIIRCLLIFLFLIIGFFLANLLGNQYPFINIFTTPEVTLSILSLLIYFSSIFIDTVDNYSLVVLKCIGLLGVTITLHMIMIGVLITTPFPLQDTTLYKMDLFLGFNQKSVIHYLSQHQHVIAFLSIFYKSLKIICLAVAILLLKKRFVLTYYRLIAYLNISFIIGSLIYYFFPSTDVAAVAPAPYFARGAEESIEQFNRLHHHQSIHHFAPGFISMPSFHTIWAMIITLLLWEYKFLRYPAMIYTFFVILSALLIGSHFLVDIIAGIVIALLTWAMVTRVLSTTTACE